MMKLSVLGAERVGRIDTTAKASKKLLQLPASHTPAPIPDELAREMDRIVADARKLLTKEKWPSAGKTAKR